MSDDNVVHLAFSSGKALEEITTMVACAACRNKTFTVVAQDNEFPTLICAACGNQISKFGWVNILVGQ